MHPYAIRTRIRKLLPWFLIELGFAQKGKDCESVYAKHSWYNMDGESSACYHCQIIKKGQLWKKSA